MKLEDRAAPKFATTTSAERTPSREASPAEDGLQSTGSKDDDDDEDEEDEDGTKSQSLEDVLGESGMFFHFFMLFRHQSTHLIALNSP